MTMTKTLMLAAFAALSLGAGTAMAQDGGDGGMDYWSRQNVIAAHRAAAANPAVAPVPAWVRLASPADREFRQRREKPALAPGRR
jgi:hypothetical protein